MKINFKNVTKPLFDFLTLLVMHRQGPLILALIIVLIISLIHSPLALNLSQ